MNRVELSFVTVMALVGCNNGPEHCVTGITIECPCAGGAHGIQTCRADGSFGACECGSDAGTVDASTTPDTGTNDAGAIADGAIDDAPSNDAALADAGGDAYVDPCAGHVFYAGAVAGAGPVWATLPTSGGLTGIEAGDSACRATASGADHACDYEEIRQAELNGEAPFAAIPAGTTAWLQRTTTVSVGGVDSPPGPGGNCVDWTYATNHIGDGEYITFDVTGVPTYHFDNDTVFDATDTSHQIPGDLQCGGETRSILCCYTACL